MANYSYYLYCLNHLHYGHWLHCILDTLNQMRISACNKNNFSVHLCELPTTYLSVVVSAMNIRMTDIYAHDSGGVITKSDFTVTIATIQYSAVQSDKSLAIYFAASGL